MAGLVYKQSRCLEQEYETCMTDGALYTDQGSYQQPVRRSRTTVPGMHQASYLHIMMCLA